MRTDIVRKIVHIGFGGCAILLKWLPTWGAAAMAGGAFLFNLWLLPHLGGKRIARTELGYDRGILLYPLSVLGLILAFAHQPAIAGAVWMILAVGDGFATLAGRSLASPRIPWNDDKSVLGTTAFLVFALPASWWIATFLGLESRSLSIGAVVIGTVLVCAVVETLPLHVDDNFTVPLAGALTMASLCAVSHAPELSVSYTEWIWLIVNAALALTGYVVRTVTVSGMIGGFLLGTVLILFAGWPLYVVLLMFFAIGTAATRIGYREKARRGIAQEEGGRRGFTHAFANVGVVALLSLLMGAAAGDRSVLWLAAVASLATATADTTASELGPLIGRRAFLPFTFREVTPGTEGAISLEGTLAGAATALLVSFMGVLMLAVQMAFDSVPGRIEAAAMNWPVLWHATFLATAAAVLGSYVESVAGSWNRKRPQRVPNGALNFFNTLVGALLVIAVFYGRGIR
jgi:uncharacterized protein (TIGR00297 family)